MFSIGFIIGALVGGTIAIALHCMVIVGKESDSKWEEEQITKNEEKQEERHTKDQQKKLKKGQGSI